ncbi:MAG: oligosaccharide flippase family protein [Bacteroidales bacterium]|nr:oligosaccharide flippase family protein [Bacteroidales bacterium]
MLKKILGTAGARVIHMGLSFVVVIINAQMLGDIGLGKVELIVLAITLIQLVSNIIGGAPMAYFAPRMETFHLMLLAYLWGILISAAGTATLFLLQLIPDGFSLHVLILSLIFSWSHVNLSLLLGKEQVKFYNIIQVLQITTLLAVLSVTIFLIDYVKVMAFVYAQYAAYSLAFLTGFVITLRYIRFSTLPNLRSMLRKILRYGSTVQVAAIFQMLNYRLTYYIVERFLGEGALGRFSVGVKLSEGMWLVGKSVSLVQYSRIVNETNPDYARHITLRFIKFTFLITLLMLAVILLLPAEFFQFVFGEEFGEVKQVMYALAPGVLAIACNMIFSHYFSGIGKPKYNAISSGIGLIGILVSGFFIIPIFGLAGAGITASIAYLISFVYLLISFVKYAHVKYSEFLISKADWEFVVKEVKVILKRRR